jgi:hypothetical protein
MTWFGPADPADGSFALGNWPVFARAVGQESVIWGHGSADRNGVKVGPNRDENFVTAAPDRMTAVSARRTMRWSPSW